MTLKPLHLTRRDREERQLVAVCVASLGCLGLGIVIRFGADLWRLFEALRHG